MTAPANPASRRGGQLIRPLSSDRASTVAAAILQTVLQHITADLQGRDHAADLRAQLADYLRDEFDDVARTTLNEIRPHDE